MVYLQDVLPPLLAVLNSCLSQPSSTSPSWQDLWCCWSSEKPAVPSEEAPECMEAPPAEVGSEATGTGTTNEYIVDVDEHFVTDESLLFYSILKPAFY